MMSDFVGKMSDSAEKIRGRWKADEKKKSIVINGLLWIPEIVRLKLFDGDDPGEGADVF